MAERSPDWGTMTDAELLARVWDWADPVVEPVDAHSIARGAAMRVSGRGVLSTAWWPAYGIVLLFALLASLVAGALVVGSPDLDITEQRLPPPFGPARNGVIVASVGGGAERSLVEIDPTTGNTVTLRAGTWMVDPVFSPDGRQIMFQELTGSMPCCTGERSSLWVMNADGSGARQLVPSLTSDRSGVGVGVGVWGGVWAPDSERIVFAHESGLGVIDVASGALTPSLGIDVDATSWIDRDVDATSWIDRIRWRPDHEQILVTVELAEGGDEAYLVSADGSGLRSLPATATHGSWSPDGSELAYTASAEAGADSPTSIHLLDVDSGIDRELTFDGSQGTDFFGEFSPDGTRLLIWRRTGISDPSCSRPSWCEYSRPFVVPLAGGGPEVRLGSFDAMTVPGEGGGAVFTPDGEQILGMYGKAPKGVWLYDADTGDETAMTGTPWNEGWWGMTWQRLAP